MRVLARVLDSAKALLGIKRLKTVIERLSQTKTDVFLLTLDNGFFSMLMILV